MTLTVVHEDNLRVVEGAPDQPFMARADDATRVIEACFSAKSRSVLLYASNLPPAFFDLSSGDAGAVLQKLRNYGVRLAVVCPRDSAQFSSRFGEMMAEEQLRPHFRIFETREAAREWLGQMLQLVPYDPTWPAAFDDEAARLRATLGAIALRIDHHGSTAVPGLAAKPIIDIQISVAALQPLSAYGSRLESLGYVHVPHSDDTVCPFFHRPERWPHTHHVHVVEHGGREERRTLAFRDYLREHPEAAREYEGLKRGLAAQMVMADAASRERYAAAKTEFIEGLISRAMGSVY